MGKMKLALMEDDDPYRCKEDEEDYFYFISRFDEKLIEFESEIGLHSILEEDKMSEFKEFCKINQDLNLWESIKKFKENS
jgi:hypothetical protein